MQGGWVLIAFALTAHLSFFAITSQGLCRGTTLEANPFGLQEFLPFTDGHCSKTLDSFRAMNSVCVLSGVRFFCPASENSRLLTFSLTFHQVHHVRSKVVLACNHVMDEIHKKS